MVRPTAPRVETPGKGMEEWRERERNKKFDAKLKDRNSFPRLLSISLKCP